ncbi:MAG TPA: N-6 DNA methylase [Solirubrobacteraceae bacterium]|jgi:adenine-specific DNA-methyltransferase|nr:N-6 DNA methylase [Solirubrobacteraceae bacterium]
MSNAAAAVDGLVADVQGHAIACGQGPREALARVLEGLAVKPADPAWADGRDVIGEAFERLIPTAGRRRLGQFFTPLWAARPMAEWLLAENPKLLLDPGVGSGSLMIGAASARKESATRLLGLDVDPLVLAMAAATRDLRGIHKLELRRADFLLDDLAERPQAITCNPPYTRHQDIPTESKAAIHDGLTSRLGRSVSRLASLHVLFLLRALEVADDDARIAFLTPAHWLDMNYAREIKALLLERAHVEALISFPVKDRIFDHAITTAAITLVRKGADAAGPTRLVQLSSRDSTETGLRNAINGAGRSRAMVLRSDRRWSGPTRAPQPKGAVRLGDVARVHRGIATGYNAFFVLSEGRRVQLEIDHRHLVPCAGSPRHFAGETLTAKDLAAMEDSIPRWLLNLKKAPRSGPLASYLHHGRARLGVRDRTLVQQRMKAGRKWFEVELEMSAPILFRYLNSSHARFVRNLAGAAPLNNWLVISPKLGVEPDELFAVLQELGHSTSLASGSRHYGKGLWKLEPRELDAVALPRSALRLI